MPDPIPRNSRAGVAPVVPPRPAPPPAPAPAVRPIQPAPFFEPPPARAGGFGQVIIAIMIIGVLVFAFGGLSVFDGIVRQIAAIVFPPSPSVGSTVVQYQPTSIPQGSGRSSNAPTALPPTVNSSANCSPSTLFSVGMTAVVDLVSTSGESTRIAAWTEPGGGIHNSDAEPGMTLRIVGGSQCVYNSEYRQYVRYWQVEFTNRNGRYVTGDAWVGESVWEGNYVNYLICRPSDSDC